MSPASPENAINVCLLRDLVLSSEALRTVAPRIAAFDAAIKVKSLPVIPRRTSLEIKSAVVSTPSIDAKTHIFAVSAGMWVFVQRGDGLG